MDEKGIKVLLVEDNPGDIRLIEEMFKEAGTTHIELESANSLSSGLACLAEGGFDVILLDLGLPDSKGLDTLNRVYAQAPGLPIVVLTGLTDEEMGIKATQEYAQDYLIKGQADSNLLVRSIRYAIELKKKEQQLWRVEEGWQCIFNSISDGISIHDVDGNIISANKALGKLFEMPPEKLLGKKCYRIFHNGEKHIDECPMLKSVLSKRYEYCEFFEPYLNLWLFISCSPLLSEKGEVRGVVHVVRDITEHKKAEEELKETTAAIVKAKNIWEATFDAISDPLFIHDKELRIVRANRAYAEAAGLPFKEIIGRYYYKIFPRMDGPFSMCINAHELQEEEVPLSSIDRIFHVRSYPIRDADRSYLYSIHILEDITEAKKAQERIKQEIEVTSHLLAVSEAVAYTIDIDRVMEKVAHCCHSIMKSDMCLSYFWNKEKRAFNPSQAIGLSPEQTPLFRTEPLGEDTWFIKLALERKDAGAISVSAPFTRENHSGKGPREPFEWIRDINTILIIPLRGRTEYNGLLLLIYRDKKELTEKDRKIIEGISHQVSTALEEARLYRESTDRAMELSRKIEILQVVQEIDRNILSTLDPQAILETTVKMIARLIPCDRATVALADKEKEGFIYAAGFGVTSVPKSAFTPFSDTSAAAVIKTGRSQYVANLTEVKDFLPLEKRLTEEGFLSHIRVPLVVKGEVIGTLNIGAKRQSAFTPEDLSTIERLASQISIALESARLFKDLEELFISIVRTLSNAIDAKSPWTRGHSERVTKIALDIAKEMTIDEKEFKNLELAGLLHDIGKLGTYETILDKPGRLSEAETSIIRQHPAKGAEILAPIRQLKDIIPAIKHHHEWYNGGGYPEGLKGEEIPLMARILTIADTVDAMGADRPYRKGKAMGEIIAELQRCSGTQFDSPVVGAFLRTLKKAA